ncbi:CHASE2 domain-containing protein [Magnetococcus sp. PR-3]|uniref:CHASE2 domain-containing protein n=1 Tax=Magnetococcus sp. PR-3 TaxID=3120355 RepID=UPI002FCE36A3
MKRPYTHMAVGLRLLIVGIVLLLGLFLDLSPIQSLQLFSMDRMQQLFPRPAVPQLPIRIVAIDEASLNTYGQWPWSRKTLATLVSQLHQMGAKGVVFDMVLAEPDRTSPEQLMGQWSDHHDMLQALKQLPTHDDLLAEQIQKLPVVLGRIPHGEASPPIRSKARFPRIGTVNITPLPHIPSLILNRPILEATAQGTGVIAQPKLASDGVLRRVNLLFRQGENLHPALSLEMLRIWAGRENILLHGHEKGLTHLQLGPLYLPTAADGSVWLHFRPLDPNRYISAQQVLQSGIDTKFIKDHWIFVGATAPGLADRSHTPLGEVVPGVEVHEQLLEQMVLEHSLTRPWWDNLAVTIILLIFAMGLWRWSYPHPKKKLLLWVMLALLLTPILSLTLFQNKGWMVDPLYPMLCMMLLTLVHVGFHLLKLERQRRQLEDRNVFWAHINHEIRTPLNPIIGLTHLTLNTDLDVQQREYLSRIEDSSRALLSIINQSLDLAKMDAGHFSIDLEPFSIQSLMERISSLYMVRATEKNLHFNTHLDEQMPDLLMGDPLRLEQVLGNLLSNAIKFTHEGGIHVQIEQVSTHPGEQVSLEFKVKDSGIGLTKSQLARLFQAFVQAEKETSRKYGGTGLGLTISQRLVEMMGGKIDVESQPSQGTCFSFTIGFPLPSMDELNRFAEPERKRPTPRFNQTPILVAEDNKTNRLLVEELLRSVGVHPTLVENGQQALDALQHGDYHAVLLDVQMPVMDGHETTRYIRQQTRWKNLPIIAMTGQAMAQERDMCLLSGMNDHLSKPVTPHLLFETLAKWLPCVRVDEPPTTTKSEEPLDADLLALESINLPIALARVQGSQLRLRQLLRIFYQDHHDDAARLQVLLAEQAWQQAEALVHSLKGTAANLSATALSQESGRLEGLFKQNRGLEVDHATLQRHLNQLCTQIEPILTTQPTSPAPTKTDLGTVKPLLVELRKLLLESNPEAENLLPPLLQACGSQHQPLVKQLQEQIDLFEFEQALELLDQLEQTL